MGWLLFSLTFILITSIICETFLFVYAYKRRTMPGATYFMYLLISMIIYNGAYIGEINAHTYSDAIFWYKVEHIGSCILIYFWFMMCVEYVKVRKKIVNFLRYVMLVQPLIFYLGFFLNDFFHLYTKRIDFVNNGYFFVLVSEKGPLYEPILQLLIHIAIITAILFLQGIFSAPKPQRSGYVIMMTGLFVALASGYITTSQYNTLGIDFYPVFTPITCAFLVVSIFRYNFFETIPIAIDMVYRQSLDGILLTDNHNKIIDANHAMRKLYPELMKINKGILIETFAQNYPEYKKILQNENRFDISYKSMGGTQYFRADVTQIVTEGNYIGKIVKISDITESVEQKKLLQQVAIIAIDKAEMNEISFLQAQINPHFINNTLSVIASMITRAPGDAKRLITELGHYLSNAYYFDSESPMIPLKKELENVETYINIKQARFGERVKFEIISEQLPDINIPRLILQPLVENATRHGILKKVEGGKVYLIIKRWNDRLFIDIRDNGVGIPDEYIHNLDLLDHNKKGIGLTNIHRRLIKYYQEGLTIKRTEIGTSVSFWIPIDSQGELSQGEIS